MFVNIKLFTLRSNMRCLDKYYTIEILTLFLLKKTKIYENMFKNKNRSVEKSREVQKTTTT